MTFILFFSDLNVENIGSQRKSFVHDKINYFDSQTCALIPSFKKSTPNPSSTNLMQLDDNLNSNDNHLKKKEFMVSTIFKDQKILKEQFGVFQVYQGVDARTWFATIKAYCKLNYQSPNELMEYFHVFLHKDLQKWFLKLDSAKKTSLDVFEPVFIDEVFDRENDLEDLVTLKQNDFMIKAKTVLKDDLFVKEAANAPLSSFLKLKILVIRLVYPKIAKVDAIRLSIFAIDDKNTKKVLVKFLNSDLNDIISLAKSLDDL